MGQSETLIETKEYKSFEKMKSKYINDNILKSHLKKVSVISYLYDKNHIKNKDNKTNVHISVSLTNEYIYPTIVLVQSALANCNKEKTFL